MTDDHSRPRSIPDINVTPMIDVTFRLLVLLLVSIPLTLPKTLGAHLPDTAWHTPLMHCGDIHRLALRAGGKVLLNGETLSGDRLERRLSEIAANSNARVLVEADKGVAYHRVPRLMVDVAVKT